MKTSQHDDSSVLASWHTQEKNKTLSAISFYSFRYFFCFTIYLKKYKYVCLDWRSVYSIHGGDGGGGGNT